MKAEDGSGAPASYRLPPGEETDMPDAVIVSAVRTPFGRAHKGRLKDIRADDLAAVAVRGALERVPALDPALVEDVILGCAFPEGEQGFNLARPVAALAGIPNTAGGVQRRLSLRLHHDGPDGRDRGGALRRLARGSGCFCAAQPRPCRGRAGRRRLP